MRAYVFTDKVLERHAGRFVWLAINSELAKNAPVRRKFPIPALPSYFLVDPDSETVIVRWVGGASAARFDAFFDEQRAAWDRRHAPASGSPLDAALARADALYGRGDHAGAAAAYREALAAAPADWREYSRVVEAALFSMSMADDNEGVVTLAREALTRVRKRASAVTVAVSGLDGALALDKSHPQRAAWVAEFEAACREIADDPAIVVEGDDRSSLLADLASARQDAGDEAGAHAALERWSRFLDAEAAKAKTPDARAVFDSHRLSAYLELGTPEKAVPMLQASERAMPDDYNPPARLAAAYKAMKRWDDALAASDRAMAKAYGPRKLNFYQLRSEVFEAKGDFENARKTVEDAIAFAEALPEGQRSQGRIDGFKKRLAGLAGK